MVAKKKIKFLQFKNRRLDMLEHSISDFNKKVISTSHQPNGVMVVIHECFSFKKGEHVTAKFFKDDMAAFNKVIRDVTYCTCRHCNAKKVRSYVSMTRQVLEKNQCFLCKSLDVAVDDFTRDERTATQTILCSKCGAKWIVNFGVTSVQFVEL